MTSSWRPSADSNARTQPTPFLSVVPSRARETLPVPAHSVHAAWSV